jgi:hypothetical protein
VLYRPIVITHTLAMPLCDAYGHRTLNDVFMHTEFMPRPAPFFTRVDDYWIWVPVKKPHSSSFDGQIYFPLPKQETAPVFVEELSDERPTKRHKPSLDCLHCGAAHVATGAKMAFCKVACQRLYYAS